MTKPFFGKSIVEISDTHANLLTPSNFTSSIWGIIYLLLGLFIVVQSRVLFQKNAPTPKEVSAIGIWFFINAILNCGWLITWEAEYIEISFSIIFINWLSLIWIYYRLANLEGARWVYTLPFSIYLGWVCIGALLHLNLLLIYLGFDFFGLTEEYWTASLIVAGIFGTLLILYLNKDIWFTMVLIWAFWGVYLRNKQLSNENTWVITMSLFAMIFLAVVGGWVALKKLRLLQSNTAQSPA